jgi:hypothetical protein
MTSQACQLLWISGTVLIPAMCLVYIAKFLKVVEKIANTEDYDLE